MRVFHLGHNMKQRHHDNRGFHTASFAYGQRNYFSGGHAWDGQDPHRSRGIGGPDKHRVKPFFGYLEDQGKNKKEGIRTEGAPGYPEQTQGAAATRLSGVAGNAGVVKDAASGLEEDIWKVDEHFAFKPGHITPILDKEWCYDFVESINKQDSPRLLEIIRKEYGYTLEDVRQWDGNTNSKTYEYVLLEQAMGTVILTYCNSKPRRSGHEPQRHPLGAAAIAAKIHAPLEIVIGALYHDILEDVNDPKLPSLEFRTKIDPRLLHVDPKLPDANTLKKLVKYRQRIENSKIVEIRKKNALGLSLEFFKYLTKKFGMVDEKRVEEEKARRLERDIDAFVRIANGRFGNRIAEYMSATTREYGFWDNSQWERQYKQYLATAYKTIGSAFAKGCDCVVNLFEEPNEKTILKAAWQMKRWQRLSVLMSEIIHYGIAAHAKAPEYRKILKGLHAVSKADIMKFEHGLALNGEREDSAKLLKGVSLSGSPMIDLYRWMDRKGRLRYEIEIPFANEQKARELILEAFGGEVANLARAKSLLPSRLTYATLISVDVRNEADFMALLPKLVKTYDGMLKKGELLPQLKGFDRKRWAAAAWKRHWKMQKALKGKPGILPR